MHTCGLSKYRMMIIVIYVAQLLRMEYNGVLYIFSLGLALGLEGSAQGLAKGTILHASMELKKKNLKK